MQKESKLKDLTEETRTNFPHPLSERKAHELIDYIRLETHADIRAKVTAYYDYPKAEPIAPARSKYKVEIEGQISKYVHEEESLAINEFSFNTDEWGHLDAFEFKKVPGYENVEEYDPAKRELWDRTKQAIQNYFTENPKSD